MDVGDQERRRGSSSQKWHHEYFAGGNSLLANLMRINDLRYAAPTIAE
jgi:hypothetical protein